MISLQLQKNQTVVITILLKSILIGICAAIPLGPTAILCVQRTLSKGFRAGHAVGMGSSFGDTFFAAIAIFSITFISTFLDDHKGWILVLGGIVIIVIGTAIACTSPASEMGRVKKDKGKRNPSKRENFFRRKASANELYSSALHGFVMTVSNPGALVLMLGIVAFFELDIAETSSSINATLLAIAGVFIGTNLWWLALTSLINTFSRKIRLSQLIAVNRIAGIVIAALGAVSIIQGVLQLFSVTVHVPVPVHVPFA